MGHYLAFDIGGTEVKWGSVTPEGGLGQHGHVPCAFSCADELIDCLAELAVAHADELLGVGVSVPGGVEDGLGEGLVLRGGSLPYLDGTPLGRILSERLGVPTTVANDGVCCALGEYAAGALAGAQLGVVLAIGTGVGGAIVHEGRVLPGAHGFAGEVSFLQNNVGAPFAREEAWGVTGGWEQLKRCVYAQMERPWDDHVDGRELFAWIEAGDEAACRGLHQYAIGFARWIVNLQTLLDPERVVIAGGISANPLLIETLNTAVDEVLAERPAPFNSVPRPQVVPARLGNSANLLGAIQPLL